MALHEAGHALMTLLTKNYYPAKLELYDNPEKLGIFGRCVSQPINNILDDVDELIEILLAGPCTTAIFADVSLEEAIWDMGGDSDFFSAYELLAHTWLKVPKSEDYGLNPKDLSSIPDDTFVAIMRDISCENAIPNGCNLKYSNELKAFADAVRLTDEYIAEEIFNRAKELLVKLRESDAFKKLAPLLADHLIAKRELGLTDLLNFLNVKSIN